ncbi:MAG: hypothetical protein ABWJ99_02905 [Caldimicrobium sp.]
MAEMNQFYQLLTQLLFQNMRIAGYLARQEIKNILEEIRKKDPKRLEPYGFKVYSQNEEDGIIEEIFKRLKIDKGIFVEIGVENGLECNTLYLLHKGWKGLWIEANTNYVNFIKNKFDYVIKNGKLMVLNEYVRIDNINRLIAHRIKSEEFEFLSIDIDGMDVYLLEYLTKKPLVICIEYNSKFPPKLHKKPPYNPNFWWQGTDYMGSSLKAIVEVAEKKGYVLVGTNITGTNAFFLRKDLWNNELFPDPDPIELYNPPRYWLYFDYFKHIGHAPDFGPYLDLMQ